MLLSCFSRKYIEAGCDEAGRGCLAGPVVAAAVILPKRYRHEILNDSKQLTKAERDALRIDIERDAIAWAVAEVDHEEIDRINILKESFKAMNLTVDKLQMRSELLLIDGILFNPYCVIK